MAGSLAAFLCLLLALAPQAFAAPAPYFTLSTNQTFAPGVKPEIHLYTRNVPELEFRIYHVQNAEQFMSGLSEMHSFGDTRITNFGPAEQIDEKTWLERFHDWKQGLWRAIKDFFRGQLSRPTREALQVKQASLAQRSRIVGVAQFAQIPLLNDKQLVARWRQEVPPTFVSDNQVLPIDPLPSGMYLVEATDAHLKAYTLLMVSRTALVTRTVSGQMLAYLVDRKSGVPVAGADVLLALGKEKPTHITTGDDGVAAFTAPAVVPKAGGSPDIEPNTKLWVMARSGDDIALVAPWYSSFTQQQQQRYLSYAYTDRPVYRPGHTVHFKAILRERDGDHLILPTLKDLHVLIADEQQKQIFDKRLPLSAMGSVQGDVELPKNVTLGFYNISFGQDANVNGYASFRVEEYRKPEYQVRVSAAHPRVLEGESNQATIDARYFFGEPVANAKVKYRVYESPHYWWGDPGDGDDNSPGLEAGDADNSGDDSSSDPGDQNSEKQGRLNADGKLTVTIPTGFVGKQRYDKDYTVEGAVTDEAGREIAGRYRFLATYGSFRIHVEPLSYTIDQGQQASFQLTAVDYDGRPVQTSIHVHVFQRKPGPRGTATGEIAAGDADATTGSDGMATVKIPISLAGSIIVVASALTPEHRELQDESWIWVNGNRDTSGDYSDGGGSRQLQIIADKKSYAPGDIAHLTLVSQVNDFHALVTGTGYTMGFRKVLATSGRSLSFDLPITEASQPNLTIDAIFVKDGQFYQARKSIKIPPSQEQLQITVTPAAQTFQPGQSALYDLTTRDSTGLPVSAELSFGVVDEAIYSLYKDSSGDIVKSLYPDRDVYPDFENSLFYYFTGEAGMRSPMLADRRSRYRPQLAQVKPGNDVVQPRVRKAFPDTAFWQPDVRTDSQGHARVSLNFPDSLTTWRATIHAVTADSRAGSAVNRVIVRKNIIVRMGQPRFLRKGDVIAVPVIVHNYLHEQKQIELSLDATGVEIVSGKAQQVTVNPGADATVIYRLRASAIGTAKLTAKALSTVESDALEISLPVEPAGVPITIASSGALVASGDHTAVVNFPTGTDIAAHSLQIQASPSIAGSLFSALDYLTSFPYGCTEQTMSSFLPNIIVANALNQLHLPSRIDQTTLNAKISAGLDRLNDYRHADGGWGWWKEDQSQVFMTAYVVSGLAQAAKAGYPQAQPVYAGGAEFLKRMLAEHPRMLPELRAYSVYALAESGEIDQKQLDTLWSRRSDLTPEGLAYTGLAMLDAKDPHATQIASLLESKAKQEGELVSWTETRNDLLDIDSDASAEATAFALKFLVHADSQSPLLQKAAQWLVANRSKGLWWSSTQETAFVLFGLTDYLVNSQELSADLDVEVFVNGASAGKRHFSGQDAANGASLLLSLDAVHLQPERNEVRVVTRGSGHTYWSTQGGYYSTAKSSYQSGSLALNITRDYYLLTPVQKDGHIIYHLDPLHGPVAQGDVLAVHLGVSGSRQKYLLIEDPIPAGTEFLQQTDGYNIEGRPDTWDWWFTRQEFHDDRAAIFASEFSGRHDSFYLLKVTNAGTFNVSPARVAPMYQPGVQATTDELYLEVKEASQ